MQRQDDGILEPFPIWDDVRTFDGKPWAGIVGVVSGGFPCQDISAAGRGAGIDGERSGLWKEFARIIGEVQPRYVLVENSPLLTVRGLGRVLGDLAALGYDARWGVLSAADAIWLAGTPCLDHLRERIWIVAWDTNIPRLEGRNGQIMRERARERAAWAPDPSPSERALNGCGPGRTGRPDPSSPGKCKQALCEDADTSGGRCSEPGGRKDQQQGRAEVVGAGQTNGNGTSIGRNEESTAGGSRGCELPGETGGSDCPAGRSWWGTEPGVGRVVHGMGHRVDRIKALGNGQVPAVVKLAWETLS